MMKTNINNVEVVPMEKEKVTEAVFNYSGKLIALMYDGNLCYDLYHNINKISENLINFHEASHKINKNKKEYKNDKLFYINIARVIGLNNTIKAMEEELTLRERHHRASYEAHCLKSLKKMARRCK